MTGKPAPMIPVLLFALAAFGHAAEARRVSVAVPDLSASLIAFVVAKEKRFYEAHSSADWRGPINPFNEQIKKQYWTTEPNADRP
jgi:hypothetical protein